MLSIANTDRRTTERLTSDSPCMLFGFRKPLYSCTKGMCHSSTCPGTSLHMISLTRPSPALVLKATNTGVRRSGYEATPRVEQLQLYVLYVKYTITPLYQFSHVRKCKVYQHTLMTLHTCFSATEVLKLIHTLVYIHRLISSVAHNYIRDWSG